MSFHVEYGDITKYRADALVIPANPRAVVGNGLDRLIYHLAGRNRLLQERRKFGEMEIGSVCVTGSCDLWNQGVHYIIHAVSPGYDGGKNGEEVLLRSCYLEALKAATEKGCKSIVFPLLSTGVLRYPVDVAQRIANEVCSQYASSNDIDITLVLYQKQKEPDLKLSEDLQCYLAENDYSNFKMENYLRAESEWADLPEEREEREILLLMRKQLASKRLDEEGFRRFEEKRKKAKQSQLHVSYLSPSSLKNLDNYVNEEEVIPSFEETLEKFMREKKIKNYAELSERGQIHESTISRLRYETIRVHRDYLWSIAIALKLDEEETETLFNSCGQTTYGKYRLNGTALRREKIIRYFIMNKIYNIHELNYQLLDNKMKLLGNKNDIEKSR